MLPYFLGCPSWSEPAWRGSLYPTGTASREFLAHYCRVFNTVEGNTTFYARPSPETVAQWAQRMPAHFRFCAKLPRDISHEGDLRDKLADVSDFLALLAPLGARLSPVWLQLPARFGPERLPELAAFLAQFPSAQPLAVEVRHLAFFAKGEEERALNRLLLAQGVERIALDSRALFSCRDATPAVLHAQSRKPRLPIRAAAFTSVPQVRFIGHPDLAANDVFLAPWVQKVAAWLSEGRTPHVYLHTPDNHLAAALAQRFHQQLSAYWPELPALLEIQAPTSAQLGLL